MTGLLTLALLASAQAADIAAEFQDEVPACHTSYVDRYVVLDEPAETVVRGVRAACAEKEDATLKAVVDAFMRRPEARPGDRPDVERKLRETMDRAYNEKLLHMVLDARTASRRG